MEKEHIIKLLYAGITTQQLHRIINQFGTLHYAQPKYETLFKDEKLRQKVKRISSINIEDIEKQLADNKIETIFCNETRYPSLLKEITDYPFILFCRGDLSILEIKHRLAIVGGRIRTTYTTEVLQQFIPKLQNITVVSGLAKGTDADAHVIACLHQRSTIGVLAFGHLHHYPEETKLLRQHMERHQLVISEYPPAVHPKPWHFPERNRIISGLCQGTLVTEAKKRSGSLITIDQALDQNRNVYCLPGPITSIYSEGCNMRISEGAKLVQSVDDIVVDYIL